MCADHREKKNKPLKNPLKELVVVHTDKDFLADIEGEATSLHAHAACDTEKFAHLIAARVPRHVLRAKESLGQRNLGFGVPDLIWF